MGTTNYIALHDGLYWVFANGRPFRPADMWEVERHKKEAEEARRPPVNVIIIQRRQVGDMTAPWRRLETAVSDPFSVLAGL